MDIWCNKTIKPISQQTHLHTHIFPGKYKPPLLPHLYNSLLQGLGRGGGGGGEEVILSTFKVLKFVFGSIVVM